MSFNARPIKDVLDDETLWIQGRIVGAPPLVSPLTKRPCFYYGYYDGTAGHTKGAPELTIEDDTGIAIVVMTPAAIIQLDYDVERDGHREGILGPGELIAVHGRFTWERDPDTNRLRLYRDPVPMRLRVTASRTQRLWISEDVPERNG
jgi:hypothetical protein